MVPAPRSPVCRPGSLSENRRPVGIYMVINVVGAVGHIGVHPFGLERVGDEDGSLGGGNEEYEGEASVPVRVVDSAELDALLTSNTCDAVLDLNLAPSHIAQQPVHPAQLDEGHSAL